jgi:hypothetical protein
MTVHVTSLKDADPAGYEFVGNLITSQFLDGQCYEFALALSEELGWPIVGIMVNEGGKEIIRHVALLTPAGTYFDARGHVGVDTLTEPFGVREYFLKPNLVRADMEAVRTIYDNSIRLARKLAESFWPDLPWKETRAMQARHFLADLEELSRKHGIWVFGNLPTEQPGLSFSDSQDEAGYTLKYNATGLSMCFSRRFNHE